MDNVDHKFGIRPLGVGLGSWATTASYPFPVGSPACAQSLGQEVCVGGQTSTAGAITNAVYTTSLNAGGFGGWSGTINYPTAIQAPSCVIASGVDICVGGYTGSAPGTTGPVYYASLTGSGVSAWSSTNPYPAPEAGLSCVSISGDVICTGGYNLQTGAWDNEVYYASTTGTGVGAWTPTTAYPIGISDEGCVAISGADYCAAGASTPGGDVSYVYYAQASGSGVSGWTSGPNYPSSVQDESCVESTSDWVCIGGYSNSAGSNTASVEYATVSPSVSGWSGLTAYPSAIAGAGCVTNSGVIYCTSGFPTPNSLTASSYYNTLTATKNPSSTSISCTATTIQAGQSTTCEATVTGSGGTPTGTVVWSQISGTGSVSTSPPTCTLSGGSCSTTVTGTYVGSSMVQAAYSGDGNFQTSSQTLGLAISQAATKTTVGCTPPSFPHTSSTTCVATVTQGYQPTGTVSFSSTSGGGSFSNGGLCTLSGSTCSITYSDSNVGTPTITSNYGGDHNNGGSSGTTTVAVEAVYQVSFAETGLSVGTYWSVTLGSSASPSTTNSVITFNNIVNNQYPYTINAPTGYSLVSSTPTSPITVSGANIAVTVTFQANGPLSANPTVSKTLGVAPLSVTFYANPSGGYPSYSFYWTFGDGGTSTQQNPTYTYSAPSSYFASVTVTDSNGNHYTASAPEVSVLRAIKITAFVASPTELSVGSVLTFQVATTQPVGTLSESYSGLPQGCPNTDATSFTCIPSAVGPSTISVVVTDSGTQATASASVSIRVVAVGEVLSITSFTATPAIIAPGGTSKIVAQISGGVSPITFSYSGQPTDCPWTDSDSFTCTPSESGTYQIMVNVTDSIGVTAKKVVTLTIEEAEWLTDNRLTVTDVTTFAAVDLCGMSMTFPGMGPIMCLGGATLIAEYTQEYLVTPTSTDSGSDFQNALSNDLGITVPPGYSPSATIIISIQPIQMVNGIFGTNLNTEYFDLPLFNGDIPGMMLDLKSTPTGTINLAFTLSSYENVCLSLGCVVALGDQVIQVAGDLLKTDASSIIDALKTTLSIFLKMGDLTVTDITSDLQTPGTPLQGYTFLDFHALEIALETPTSPLVAELQQLSNLEVVCLKGLVGDAAAVPSGGTSLLIGAPGDVQCVITAIDTVVDSVDIWYPEMDSNWLYIIEKGVMDGFTSFVDPYGDYILPTVYSSQGDLLLGYNASAGQWIEGGNEGILQGVNGSDGISLQKLNGTAESYRLHLIAEGPDSAGFVPYNFLGVIGAGNNSSSVAYSGLLRDGQSLDLWLNSSANGTLARMGNISSFGTWVPQSNGNYSIHLYPFLSNGTAASASACFLDLNSSLLNMTVEPDGSCHLDVSLPSGMEALSTYVVAPGIPGGFHILTPTLSYGKVVFSQSGLPSGSKWSVTLDGTTLSSVGRTITFNETNGTYFYSIGLPASPGWGTRYNPNVSFGDVMVSGAALQVGISFSLQFQLGTLASPVSEGNVAPSGIQWFNNGSAVNLTATPNSGYLFSGWTSLDSGGYSGIADPITILITKPINETANFVPTGTELVSIYVVTRPSPCGSLRVDAGAYLDGDSLNLQVGMHTYLPISCSGYEVEGVSASGGVTIYTGNDTFYATANATIVVTSVTTPTPSPYLTITTRPTDCGGLDVDGANYSNRAVLQVALGDHSASALLCPGYEVSGISVSGAAVFYPGNGTLFVSGNATIVVTYVQAAMLAVDGQGHVLSSPIGKRGVRET